MEGAAAMRKRLFEHSRRVGVSELRDEEVYESLLTYGSTSVSMLSRELGTKLCGHMRGFERFASTSREEFEKIEGVDDDTALFLCLLTFICRRGEEQREESSLLDSPAAAARFIVPRLHMLDHEVTMLLCLSDDLRCTQCRIVAEGGAFSTQAGAFPIASVILNSGARIAILAHNHPAGGPEPSEVDVMVTYRLLHALKSAGITLLDHIIVSGISYTSMAAHGDFRGETEKERSVYCPLPDTDGGTAEA